MGAWSVSFRGLEINESEPGKTFLLRMPPAQAAAVVGESIKEKNSFLQVAHFSNDDFLLD